MELAGKVIAVLEPRSGVSKTGNEWKVQEYVIETHDQYPRKMCFDCLLYTSPSPRDRG
mgnify:CR=1 FL=1